MLEYFRRSLPTQISICEIEISLHINDSYSIILWNHVTHIFKSDAVSPAVPQIITSIDQCMRAHVMS